MTECHAWKDQPGTNKQSNGRQRVGYLRTTGRNQWADALTFQELIDEEPTDSQILELIDEELTSNDEEMTGFKTHELIQRGRDRFKKCRISEMRRASTGSTETDRDRDAPHASQRQIPTVQKSAEHMGNISSITRRTDGSQGEVQRQTNTAHAVQKTCELQQNQDHDKVANVPKKMQQKTCENLKVRKHAAKQRDKHMRNTNGNGEGCNTLQMAPEGGDHNRKGRHMHLQN